LNRFWYENTERTAKWFKFPSLNFWDIELTEDEIAVKKKMQKLKEDFDGEDGQDQEEVYMKKREQMTAELDKRLTELKTSKDRNYLILGVMVLVMTVLSFFMCKKNGSVKLDKEVERERDLLQAEK
jgi:hypothetical protein